MQEQRPHDIRQFGDIPRSERFNRKWLPLTDSEAEMLAGKAEDERNAWLNSLSIEERLRRFQKAEEAEMDIIPDVLAKAFDDVVSAYESETGRTWVPGSRDVREWVNDRFFKRRARR